MSIEVSIVLPCRNEEKSVGLCIEKIKKVFKDNKINGEVIVSDSSSDRSASAAKGLGAKVVSHGKEGYGIACLEGFKAAKGKYLILGDADNTYDFSEILKFLDKLDEGYDFVIGKRFDLKNGAMPFLHRYFGNPFLTWVLRLFFKAKVSDAHCGMRAIRRDALDKLDLRATGMEFASEMIVKAVQNNLKISEVPITYHPRVGESKLSSFRDGWRHLRFMLIYSPTHLFLFPGTFLFFIGLVFMFLLLSGPLNMGSLTLYTHPMVIGSLLTIVGFQIINLGFFAKTYAVSSGLSKNDKLVDFFAKHVSFEKGLILGVTVFLVAFLINLKIFLNWYFSGMPALSKLNLAIFATTFIILGIQIMFSSLLLSILLIRKK